ncbi:MAG TPA: response regulator, partial [Bryobacteraceae bacterium]
EQHKIDLLVTDVVMDDMDGWTLALSLLERHPDLPIVFMSGYPANFEADLQKFGRCAFLPKPFQPADLMNAISDVVVVTVP